MKQHADADRRRHRPAGERRRDDRRGRPRQRVAARPDARAAIDAALYNAFGQRQVATIYDELNQYHVVMEWAPRYTQSPNALADVYVPAHGATRRRGGDRRATTTAARDGAAQRGSIDAAVVAPTRARATRRPATRSATPSTPLVPLSAVARFVESATATSINHQDTELATTISFNLAEGATLDDAQPRDQAGRGRHRHADQRARRVPGHRAARRSSRRRSRRC